MEVSAFTSEQAAIIASTVGAASQPGRPNGPGELRVIEQSGGADGTTAARDEDSAEISKEATDRSRPVGKSGEPLTDAEVQTIEKLKARDQEVRVHEQAHVAAAGSLFRGGPTYSYQTGPDGQKYAVGGSVQIDTSPGSTPEETITKAQQIRRAALAPAEPSSTDQNVAAKASRMEADARAELSAEQADTESTEQAQAGVELSRDGQQLAEPEPPARTGFRAAGIDAYLSGQRREPTLNVAA